MNDELLKNIGKVCAGGIIMVGGIIVGDAGKGMVLDGYKAALKALKMAKETVVKK